MHDETSGSFVSARVPLMTPNFDASWKNQLLFRSAKLESWSTETSIKVIFCELTRVCRRLGRRPWKADFSSDFFPVFLFFCFVCCSASTSGLGK